MNTSLPYRFYSQDGLFDPKGEPVTRKASRPFSLVHTEKSPKAVVCIHGYTGYPGELVRPAEDLHEAGFDVFVPRLPGHGTTGRDFASSTSRVWLKALDRVVEELVSSYGSVDLVGHSMGGALAVLLAQRHPEVRKVVLACPAICVDLVPRKTRTQLSIVSFFRKRLKGSWQGDPSYNLHYEGAPGDDEYFGGEYWSWVYPRQILELQNLMNEATQALGETRQDFLLVTAGEDGILPASPEPGAKEALGDRVRLVNVPKATHYIYYDKYPEAEEKACRNTVEFLSE